MEEGCRVVMKQITDSFGESKGYTIILVVYLSGTTFIGGPAVIVLVDDVNVLTFLFQKFC